MNYDMDGSDTELYLQAVKALILSEAWLKYGT